MMRMTTEVIDPDVLRRSLFDEAAGAYCSFEGWIRNHNEGQNVLRLEYEAYEPIATSEGEIIIRQASDNSLCCY